MTLLGKDGTGDGRARDRITFTIIPYRRFSEQVPEGDLCDVSYYLEQNPQGRIALFREEDCTPDAEREGDGVKLELTDMVVGLNILYFDTDGSHDQWPPGGGTEAHELPQRVALALTLQDAQQYERVFFTTVLLVMGPRDPNATGN
jgi:hypothetical protein